MPRSVCHLVAFLLTVAVCVSDATGARRQSPATAAEAIRTRQEPGVLRANAGPLSEANGPLATPVVACVSPTSLLPTTPSAPAATPGTGPLVGLEVVLELQPAPGQLLDTPTLLGIPAVLQRRLALLGLSGDILRHRDGTILVRVDATDYLSGHAHPRREHGPGDHRHPRRMPLTRHGGRDDAGPACWHSTSHCVHSGSRERTRGPGLRDHHQRRRLQQCLRYGGEYARHCRGF